MANIGPNDKPTRKVEPGISEQEKRDRERELQNALDKYHSIHKDIADATVKLGHAVEQLAKFEKVDCKKPLLASIFLFRRTGAAELSKVILSLRNQTIRASEIAERMEKRTKRDLEEEILNPSLHR